MNGAGLKKLEITLVGQEVFSRRRLVKLFWTGICVGWLRLKGQEKRSNVKFTVDQNTLLLQPIPTLAVYRNGNRLSKDTDFGVTGAMVVLALQPTPTDTFLIDIL